MLYRLQPVPRELDIYYPFANYDYPPDELTEKDRGIFIELLALVEVVDPRTGEPVDIEEKGELVVITFYVSILVCCYRYDNNF